MVFVSIDMPYSYDKKNEEFAADFYDYNEEDRWHVALDSGGYQYSRYYFVRKGAEKNKDIQLRRLNSELDSLKRQVKLKEEEIERILIWKK